MGMQITVKDKNDAVKAETAGREQAVLAWKGDCLLYTSPSPRGKGRDRGQGTGRTGMEGRI